MGSQFKSATADGGTMLPSKTKAWIKMKVYHLYFSYHSPWLITTPLCISLLGCFITFCNFCRLLWIILQAGYWLTLAQFMSIFHEGIRQWHQPSSQTHATNATHEEIQAYLFYIATYLLPRSNNNSIKIRPLVHQSLQLEWVSLIHVEDSPINLNISSQQKCHHITKG